MISDVMRNPAGEKLAWDFVLTHWDAVEKVGGPFASAEVVDSTSSFCAANMRDQVVDFFAAHKIEGAERTYRQSIERINNCVDLKSQQEPQRRRGWDSTALRSADNIGRLTPTNGSPPRLAVLAYPKADVCPFVLLLQMAVERAGRLL